MVVTTSCERFHSSANSPYQLLGCYCKMHMLSVISLVKTAESKPANGKPSSADTINGVTSEEMIRMNIEKLKKRAAPKPQKAPTSRFVNLVTVFDQCSQ